MKKEKKYKINIVELPNDVLRKNSNDIKIPLSKEDEILAEMMIYHIDDSQKDGSEFRPGVGVAAVQYGILKNVFYVFLQDNEQNIIFKDVLFNPKIVFASKMQVALNEGEGCLSVPETYPNQEGYVHRSKRIIVDAYSYFEKKFLRYEVSDYLAIIFQHELDHLNGKLFIDRISKKNPWLKKQGVKYI
ncbi:peptide deformylase [Mycoplasmopsis cynos]|uniref:peptide deformylase n=1 Tax=Mycoplasmopsis cynos TaxID=171284 RepID=UPI002B00029D|nr:peptide deformylase [Mycoplasmopsis cynos]WQQ13127.1 peptide deformylase [Mycoplasmopsis cynos]WQQ14231.1 peptide deformylase [Mycoplasmopsis cynos]WQQ16995.1 peptide deformylase [Mycoplasmopsis cynos]WQQ19520.1 peptide deformylase [Mycoplasmopsis cynos]